MSCEMGDTECAPPNNQGECDFYGAAGFNILTSYANLFNTVNVLQTAIIDSIGTIDLGSVNSTFWAAPQTPPPWSVQDFFKITLAFLGGFGGTIGGLAGDASTVNSLIRRDELIDRSKITANDTSAVGMLKTYARTATSVISGAIGALPANPGPNLDLQSALASIQRVTISSLDVWTDAIFGSGQLKMSKGQTWTTWFDNQTFTNSDMMRINDLMANGALLEPPGNGTSHVVRDNVTRIVYAQLAEYSWKNDNGLVSFIT